MKEKLFAILIAFLLTITGIAIVNADKPAEKIGANKIDPNGFHYTLNILGKKADWKGGGGYNNPDRSTIFVPQNTDDFSYVAPNEDVIDGSIAIYFSKGTDFAVIDGNAFDGDGSCSIELPDKKFSVWICSRAKPGYSTDIDGMVYAEDAEGGWYVYCIGTITVKRHWTSADDLFWVDPTEDIFGYITDPQWIFDYLETIEYASTLTDPDTGDPIDIVDMMYLWDYDNNGNKLVKVRFYPI